MYTYGYLFYLPINFIFIIILGANGILKKRRREYFLYAAILIIYLNFLINKAFFPLFADGSQHYTGITKYMNFNISTLFHYSMYQIVGNLLLTFPIGFFLPFVINCKQKTRIIYSILFSISIEFIQLALIGGFHIVNMTFDINDIILNVTGCVLGNIIFRCICKIYTKIPTSATLGTTAKYFNQVCDNCANDKKSLSGVNT